MIDFYIHKNTDKINTRGISIKKEDDNDNVIVISGYDFSDALNRYMKDIAFKNNGKVDMSGLNLSFNNNHFNNEIYFLLFSTESVKLNDFDYIDFSNCYFNNFSFCRKKMKNINFNNSVFKNVNFYGANAKNIIFNNAKINNVNFENTVFCNTQFLNTKVSDCKMKNSIWHVTSNHQNTLSCFNLDNITDASKDSRWYGTDMSGMDIDKKKYKTLHSFNMPFGLGFFKRNFS
jgi:uncharacterized protein YjbI with pentapeptide repeats